MAETMNENETVEETRIFVRHAMLINERLVHEFGIANFEFLLYGPFKLDTLAMARNGWTLNEAESAIREVLAN